MNCPSCGSMIPDGASFCERCGRQVGTPPFRSWQLQPLPKKNNKSIWIAVVVVIVVIVLLFVLADALLSSMIGFDGTNTQPTSYLTVSKVANGDRLTFAPTNVRTDWMLTRITLTDGTNRASWDSPNFEPAYQPTGAWIWGSRDLGGITVWCNITSPLVNGFINPGDYITLETSSISTFSANSDYTVSVVYTPSSSVICQATFTG